MTWTAPASFRTFLTATGQPLGELIDGVRSRLACRGETAYLARVEPGRIQVAPVAFEDVKVHWTPYTALTVEGRTLFSRLVNGVVDWDQDVGREDGVFARLRTLLMLVASRARRSSSRSHSRSARWCDCV